MLIPSSACNSSIDFFPDESSGVVSLAVVTLHSSSSPQGVTVSGAVTDQTERARLIVGLVPARDDVSVGALMRSNKYRGYYANRLAL